MSIEAKRDKSRDLTLIKVTGVLTYEKVMKLIEAFYAGEPTKNVLWDLVDARENKLSLDQMDDLISYQPRFDGKGDSGKTAIVAQDGHLWGLSRMLAQESNKLEAKYTVMVFSSEDAAHRWLNGG